MKDRDTQLIFEAYNRVLEGTDGTTSDLTSNEKIRLAQSAAEQGEGPLADTQPANEMQDPKTKLIYMIRQLESLMPNLNVGWEVRNGDFVGAIPEHAGKPIGKNYERSFSGLEEFLTDIWDNEQFAQEHNLTDADWTNTTRKYSFGQSLYWFANDSRGVEGNRETSTYINRLFNLDAGIPESEGFIKYNGEFVPPNNLSDELKEMFRQQTHGRLVLSPRSEEISGRGAATSDAVGYGKGRYMGD